MSKTDKNMIEEEIWKDIPDYEGMYQVSNLGRVKSLSRLLSDSKGDRLCEERILKQSINKGDYRFVGLNKNGKSKTRSVHQLVAMGFLNHKPCGFKLVVDHINNISSDNRLCNLQVITQRENCSKDKKNKSAKYTGVYLERRRYLKASILFNGEAIRLGSFDTEEEASEYYQNALNAIDNGEEIVVKKPIYSSKYKGVFFTKEKNKWGAFLMVKNKFKNVGLFDNEEEAFKARNKLLKDIENGLEVKFNKRQKHSKHKGITYCKKDKRWVAFFCSNNKSKRIGGFKTEDEAYEARCKYIEKLNN